MIIAMWSGPRNLSTAMMRSFGARADCAVMDEPFFAPFLEVTGKPHPGRDETLAVHETNPERVAQLCSAPTTETYFFQKHMPHHMLDDFPLSWAEGAKHFFLLRHPQRVIASYAKGRAEFDLDDLGFAAQHRLWVQLGQPPVIHSETILTDPTAALTALCAEIKIPYDPAMLSWLPGPRDEDGAWAPWWYDSVWRSTGFGVPPGELPSIATQYQSLFDACITDYEALARHAIQV
ncbi:MAG: HAD family hydrolase [Litorimonas sp.]